MAREIQFEDFKLAFLSIRKSKLILIFATLAGLFAGLLLTADSAEEQRYTATSSVCITNDNTDIYKNTTTMVNYLDVVTSHKVCEYAASMVKETLLSAEDIQHMIVVALSDNSYVMKINVQNQDSEVAIKVTNAVADAFVSEMSNITDDEKVQVLDSAVSAQIIPDGRINFVRLLSMMGAFCLAALIIGIRSLLSNKVRSVAQCVEDEDEILGIIPFMN